VRDRKLFLKRISPGTDVETPLGNLEDCKWELVSFSLQYSPAFAGFHSVDIRWAIGQTPIQFQHIRVPTFPLSVLTWKIGGLSASVELKLPSCLLGPFNFIKGRINVGSIEHIFNRSPFFENHHDRLSDCQISNNYVRPMLKILTESPIYESILPLFEHVKLMAPEFLEFLIDLLPSIAYLKPFEYFPSIAQILRDSGPTVLTRALFSRFYSLLQLTQNESLLISIIVNFELLSVALPNELALIMDHLLEHLTSLPRRCLAKISMQKILADLRVLFFAAPSEEDIIECDSRLNKEHTFAVRFELLRFLRKFADCRYTRDDAISIVSHIVACTDEVQVLALLGLLRDLPRLPGDSDFAPPLLKLLSQSKSVLFVEALMTILKLPDPSWLIKHINLVLNENHYTTEIVILLSNLIIEYPLLLPIFCIIIANMGPENQKLFNDTLQNIVENSDLQLQILSQADWYVWPILTALHFEPQVHQTLATFLFALVRAGLTLSLFDAVFGFLRFLNACGDSSDIMMMFFQLILQHCKDDRDFARPLIPRGIVMLFFSGDSMRSSLMRAEFRSFDMKPDERVSPKYIVRSFSELFDLAKAVDTSDRGFHIEIRPDGSLKYGPFFEPFIDFVNHVGGNPIHARIVELIRMVQQRNRRHNSSHFDWTPTLENLLPSLYEYVGTARIFALRAIASSYQHDFAVPDPLPDIDLTWISKGEIGQRKDERRLQNLQAEQRWDDLKARIMTESSIWSSLMHFSNRVMGTRIVRNLVMGQLRPFRTRTESGPFHGNEAAKMAVYLVKMDECFPAECHLFRKSIQIFAKCKVVIIRLDEITAIAQRYRKQALTALEFFLRSGKHVFVDFYPVKASAVLDRLKGRLKP
jgi:hypothetical protein